ncbi:MAG TPA: hypothetical protein VK591_05585 [Xanthobacteraceae bacterium]|nr:hypothetical protein [Xanthobacteraceae bacterium]
MLLAAFAKAKAEYKVKRDNGQAAMRRPDTSPDLERAGGLI